MDAAIEAKRSFYILWIGQFFSTCSLTIIVPLLPFYMAELGATLPEENRIWTGLALAAPAVTLCLFSPIWGRYRDRWRVSYKALLAESSMQLQHSLVLKLALERKDGH